MEEESSFLPAEEAYKSSLSPQLQTPGSVYYLCHWPSSASPSLLHYKTFLLYLSPVSHNYSLISTRWLHWQLGLTLPITDINSFLALLDVNLLWIWIRHSIMRIKTGWRNWEESHDPTNKMLPSSFFPLQTRRASAQVIQSTGQTSIQRQ